MKVLVPVERVIDDNRKVRVTAAGSVADLANVKMPMPERTGTRDG